MVVHAENNRPLDWFSASGNSCIAVCRDLTVQFLDVLEQRLLRLLAIRRARDQARA